MPPKHRQSRRLRKALAYEGSNPNPHVDYAVESGAAGLFDKSYALVPDEDWNFPVRGPRG